MVSTPAPTSPQRSSTSSEKFWLEEIELVFAGVHSDGEVPEDARWTSGTSVDSKGEFSVRKAEPMGDIPKLAPAEARPELHSTPIPAEGGLLRKAKDAVTP